MNNNPLLTRYPLTRRDFFIASGIFLLALLARSPLVIHWSSLLHPDEAVVGLMAQDIAAGERFPIFFYGQRYMGALEAYVMAALNLCLQDDFLALRLTPALFFAAFAGLQYLLGTLWFGRIGGGIAATFSILCSPAIAQWTVAPRGGYVELLTVGALVLLAYSFWFEQRKPYQLLLLGFLIGAGRWINPAMMIFAVALATHFVWSRGFPLKKFREHIPAKLKVLLLPTLSGCALFFLTSLWTIEITPGGPKNTLHLPRGITYFASICILATLLWLFWGPKGNSFRKALRNAAPFLIGALLGSSLEMLYLLSMTLSGSPLEALLPLGPRALSAVSETFRYLIHGVPVLFGADPEPYLVLSQMGKPQTASTAETLLGFYMPAVDLLLGFATALLVGLLSHSLRDDVIACLSLQKKIFTPLALSTLALTIYLVIYLLNGASFDFHSIRYLVPAFCFIPLIFAGLFVEGSFRKLTRTLLLVIACCYTVGQIAFIQSLGKPHPYLLLAEELQQEHAEPFYSEPIDAHLLLYLTEQKVKVLEWSSWWKRFQHLESLGEEDPNRYLVDTRNIPWTSAWHRAQFPGPAPLETRRDLYAWLRSLEEEKAHRIEKAPLRCCSGFEIWTIYERSSPKTEVG